MIGEFKLVDIKSTFLKVNQIATKNFRFFIYFFININYIEVNK